MKLDKPTLLRLALVLGGCVVLYWALCNLALLGAALGMLAGVLFPLTLGFCIAFVLNVPMRFLERHLFLRTQKPVLKRLRRPLCILISLVFILAVLTAVFWLVVPELVNALVVLANTVPPFLAKVTAWLQDNADRFPQLESWLAGLDIDWAKTGRDIITYLTGQFSSLLGGTVQVISATVGGVTNVVIAFILALYILLGKEKLKAQCTAVCRAFLPERFAKGLLYVARLSSDTFASFVTGQCIEACILGTLCWLGMTLFRFPYAPMIGALVGITALIPIVGAWVGLIVGAFMIGMESLTQALIFVIFLLVLQQVEGNLIYPRVVGSSVGLPPIWVLAAVTVGGSLWGIAGMLFAVPVCSILHALLRLGVHRRLEAQAAAGASVPAPTPEEKM